MSAWCWWPCFCWLVHPDARIGFIHLYHVIMCIMSYLLGCRNKIVLVAFPVIFTLGRVFYLC